MDNRNLHTAKAQKNDEFYTQLVDIKRELKYYQPHFKGKIVYCNCDDPDESNFVRYFFSYQKELGLKGLIATSYVKGGRGKILRLFHKECKGYLGGDGDFRSEECIELLKEADIVVTNPPFSLFREYVTQLVEYDKKFLILGNQNAITYKDIFPLIKENKLWLGTKSGSMVFNTPDDYNPQTTTCYVDDNGQKWQKFGNICWFTNLDHNKRHAPLDLYKHYNSEEYPKYDNYDAIEVGKTAKIPMDYDGVMGVPISFLDKYCPEQFEIVTLPELPIEGLMNNPKDTKVNGKSKYARVLIRKINNK